MRLFQRRRSAVPGVRQGLSSIRPYLAGAFVPPVLGLALIGATVRFWPPFGWLTTLSRITESLSFHLLALAMVGAGALALLRLPVLAMAIAAIVLVGGATELARYRAIAAPLQPDEPAVLTLLWFNMLATNPLPPEVLISALETSPADIILLGEAAPLKPHKDRLAETFPVQAGCEQRRCEIMVLSRLPLKDVTFRRIGSLRPDRLVILRPDFGKDVAPNTPDLTIVAMHMVKPWFFGFSEIDDWFAYSTVDNITGPLVMTGDFNEATRGARVRGLVAYCDMAPPRTPPATWPAALGRFGIAIDQALVRGGATLVSLAPWGGADLGSNHRGLLMDIALSPEAVSQTGCRPLAPPSLNSDVMP